MFGGLKKLFGFSKDTKKETTDKKNLSVDRLFVENFKKNGGHFFYSNDADWKDFLIRIMTKNTHLTSAFCYETEIKNELNQISPYLFGENIDEKTIFVTPCEYLIAENGSIFFSYNQLKGKKINQYPNIILVIAKVSQITRTPQNAMSIINQILKGAERFNNTFLNEFQENRKVYLFLQEDLIQTLSDE